MEHNKDCHMFSCKNRTKDHIYMDFHTCTCTIKPSQDKTVEKTKFQFSNVVVVDETEIGVIVKTWERMNGKGEGKFYHEVYVRSYNTIKEYPEDEIEHFVYSKILSEEEKDFY